MKRFQRNIERFILPLLEDSRVKAIHAALGREAELYLVGGTVRDALLGAKPRDIDLACDYHPEKISELLTNSDIRCIPTGLKHQTVTAVVESELPAVEITSFRGPSLRPEGGVVISQSIEEDLKYRDFAVNALAFGIKEKDLIQYEGALDDIELRQLRCVGNPNERFSEDPLRALRLVRIACEKDFHIEEATLSAAAKHKASLSKVAIERIRDELDKILLSEAPRRGFRLLHQLGFLELILPEVAVYVDFEQNEFHKADLFEHTLEVVEKVPAD